MRRENRWSVFDFTALVDALRDRLQLAPVESEDLQRSVLALLRDWDRRFHAWRNR